MTFTERITEDIKQAMKARETLKLEALRGIKKELIEARTAKGGSNEVSDADAMKILQKMVKQRRETSAIYKEQGRPELAADEDAQADVIAAYLPKELTADEVEAAVKAIIAEVGATSIKEMGKVMGVASKKLAGQADGKVISDTVKKLLNN
ncbi:MAG: GatB/YqeY domain-containing protein [Marinilabiliaceae bacterium]|nr:GatB/YqeY domain-containing protein [Marinilabiliaceae bacterium]